MMFIRSSTPRRSGLFSGPASSLHRCLLHCTGTGAANVAPVLGTGPPPQPPPLPSAPRAAATDRIERRRKQAELLKSAQVARGSSNLCPAKSLSRRFWKDVGVREVDGANQIYLDSRPLKHPLTRSVIRLPTSKANLALALTLEWDLLTSAQQATKQHLVPLTSLVCRALDVAEDDASSQAMGKIRTEIATSVLRYLDTDTLLCWTPPASPNDVRNEQGHSLRDVQEAVAEETLAYMAAHVWPGIPIKPVLDGVDIVAQQQITGARDWVPGWVEGLTAWELAGLERAALAGKSLLAAARFVAEWSEGPAGCRRPLQERFDTERAARAVSLEVDWQARQWGEVEDTHDVNKEDIRRQLGGVLLLVSGTGSAT